MAEGGPAQSPAAAFVFCGEAQGSSRARRGGAAHAASMLASSKRELGPTYTTLARAGSGGGGGGIPAWKTRSKGLGRQAEATLEMIYARTPWPTDEVVASLWDLHRLRKERVGAAACWAGRGACWRLSSGDWLAGAHERGGLKHCECCISARRGGLEAARASPAWRAHMTPAWCEHTPQLGASAAGHRVVPKPAARRWQAGQRQQRRGQRWRRAARQGSKRRRPGMV